MALAKTTIFVPTRRAGRALTTELARQSPARATLLPRILPLGALDGQDEAGLDNPLDPSLPRAAGDIERRMILGELILAWARNLKQAIIAIDADGSARQSHEAMLVGAQPADAWRLSGELAALIDEMIIENLSWKNLETLNGDFDEYWRITLKFLQIAVEAWPRIQKERGFVDSAARHRVLIERLAAQMASQTDPVIALGSTGSNIATARLLAAIARAENGAVVLPGLDLHLDAPSFAALRKGEEPSATHPQAFLARLIEKIGVTRDQIGALGAPTPERLAREKFVSESFRPAETTHLWPFWRSRHSAEDISCALVGMDLIEAADEREESLTIAICLREALEIPGRTAALITPDRGLAERVRAELLRWDIEIDDSGGAALASTPAGALARLILYAINGQAEDWAALIAHPLARLGFDDEAARLARLFEIGVLRAGATTGPWREAVITARKATQARDAHPRQKAISEPDWAQLERFGERLDLAVAALVALDSERPLLDWLSAHRAALGLILCGDPDSLPGGDDGDALAQLFDELDLSANALFTFHGESYSAFFDAIIGERVARGANRAHPRLKILGLLESRLIDADRVVLAGLDETIWPPQSASDSFLNRPMRHALGLSSPDRRLGQTAHDFCQALGAEEVILTRAKKRGGSPTTPSRFLQRMEALAGAEHFLELRQRGEKWREFARQLDAVQPVSPLRRPEPKPPLALRPKKLSVTRIEMLRRDPYAIYARYILNLQALPHLDEDKGLREIGIELHSVLEKFCRDFPSGALPGNAEDILIERAKTQMAEFADDPEFQSFRWPRLCKGLRLFLAYEALRRPLLETLALEERGALRLTLADGSEFTLTAEADRIEFLRDRTAALVDYKTGEPPSYAQVSAGFAPQLTLEAAMLERGAFARVEARPVSEAFYLPIGGGKDRVVALKPASSAKDKRPFHELVVDHFEEFLALLNDFRDPSHGYPARPFPQFAARYNDFDHLARTKEWSASGGASAGEDA